MKKRIFTLLLTLCLLVSVLPLAVSAEDPYVTVKLVRYVLNYVEGTVGLTMHVTPGETKYAVTSAEGVPAEGTADNWTIKVDFPADGKPTITLKGATLKGGTNEFPMHIAGNVDLTVEVTEDSRIDATNRCGLSNQNFGVTTLTGPAKLTVCTTDANCIATGAQTSYDAGEMIIKDTNLELKPNGSSTSRSAIGFSGKDLTIDNSKINITATGTSLGISGYAIVNKNDDGSIKTIGSYWTPKNDEGVRNLTIQNGSVITGNATSRQFLGATGVITIKDSTIEAAVGKGNLDTIFNKKPILEGEYTAVAGANTEKLLEYKPSKFTSYKYFKLVPGKVSLEELGVTTAPTTEPTTAPTTEPTTAPTTEPTTEATVAPTVEATVPATQPATNPESQPTVPATQPVTDAEDGGNAGTIVVICIVALVVLAGAAATVIIMKKKAK